MRLKCRKRSGLPAQSLSGQFFPQNSLTYTECLPPEKSSSFEEPELAFLLFFFKSVLYELKEKPGEIR